MDLKYDLTTLIFDNLFIAKKKEKYDLMTSGGSRILQDYDEIKYYGGNVVICTKGSSSGAYNFITEKFELDINYNDLTLIHYNEESSNNLYAVLSQTSTTSNESEKEQKVYDVIDSSGVKQHISSEIIPFYCSERLLCASSYYIDNKKRDELRYGFRDLSGNVVIPFRYSYISHRENYYFNICKDNKWGILDAKTGKEVLSCKYDKKIPLLFLSQKPSNSSKEDAFVAIEGKLICKVREDGYFGCIDENYNEIIPCIYEDIENYNDWSVILCKYGHEVWGCFDNEGNNIVPVSFDKIVMWHSPYISAGIGRYISTVIGDNVNEQGGFDGMWTLYTLKGDVVIDGYNEIEVQEYFIIVRKEVEYKITDDYNENYGLWSRGYKILGGHYCLYDLKGMLLLDNLFKVRIINKDFACIFIRQDENIRAGVINICNPNWSNVIYDKVFILDMNYNYFLTKIDDKYGIIDMEGNKMVKPLYTNITSFDDNIAYVTDENGKCGIINNKGEVILKCEYFSINNSTNSIAEICKLHSYEERTFKYGLVNVLSGELILPLIYEDVIIRSISNDKGLIPIVEVKKDGLYGLFDIKGNEIKPMIYTAILYYRSEYDDYCKRLKEVKEAEDTDYNTSLENRLSNLLSNVLIIDDLEVDKMDVSELIESKRQSLFKEKENKDQHWRTWFPKNPRFFWDNYYSDKTYKDYGGCYDQGLGDVFDDPDMYWNID